MAIEFNCPYCTSTIRVKDNAAGKRGKCPRCSKPLLVPDPRPPQQPVAPAAPAKAETEIASPPATAPPELEAPAGLPDVAVQPQPPIISPSPANTTTTFARPTSRRRGSGPLVVGILGVCFVTIIGLLGYLWWVNKPLVLEGTLEGEVVSATTLRPATVDVTSIDQPTRKSVLDALRELPYSLKSSLVVTEFRSRSDALEVRLVPTTTTTVVRVSPKEDPQLAAWVAEQQTVLATRRQTELLEATQRFFDDYSAYRADGTRMGDGGYYRNRLGLGATNVSLGYFVEAVASNQACPCVFEDSQGNLYFVVPRQTSSFTVRGRKLSDGTRLFPGTYTVDCSAIRESFEVVTPPTDPKADESKAGSDSEPTSSDQGDDKKPMMDPNSDNPDSEPTSSSSEEPPMMSGSMKQD